MSKIAKQKSLEAYPIKEEWVGNQYGGLEDTNSLSREKYQEGYDQAMQDFLEKAMEYFKGKPIHHFWIEQFKNYMEDE